MVLSLLCMLAGLTLQAGNCAPIQFIYDDAAKPVKVSREGCNITSWEGSDPYGMVAPPWVTYVSCDPGASYTAKGVATHGEFQIFLHKGTVVANGRRLTFLGEAFWASQGAHADIIVEGSAYIVGAKFVLNPAAKEFVFTSSWAANKTRHYQLADAIAGNNAALGHDGHICNGSSPSMDFTFQSPNQVEPPMVVVLNCAGNGVVRNSTTSFVWSHFHPYGAMYLPFSGGICFATDTVACISPGTARWTSPNLQYYEYFTSIEERNPMADSVVELAGRAEDCGAHPNVFAVTNFDATARGGAGVPNFADWPENSHEHSLSLGIGPWGTFGPMMVQNPRFMAAAATVDADGDLQMVI